MSPHRCDILEIRQIVPDSASKANFGAVVTGVDLNELDDTSFDIIKEAVYKHSVVIVKNQHSLIPRKQFELVRRFDPDATASHGFDGFNKGKGALGSALGANPFYYIPGSGSVTLVGHGYQGDDHFGLKNVTLRSISHADYHASPLSAEEVENGQARFNAFHFDGIVYDKHPSPITTFRCVRMPQGPDVNVKWSNGEGEVMQKKCPPGCTAFISSAQVYDLLTPEEKALVENSFWEPAPHPFKWYGTRKFRSSGIGMEKGGETIPLEDLPPWSPEKVHKYPMVWTNPVTGARGFQVMPELVKKIFTKSSPHDEEQVVEDSEEIRLLLNRIFDRVARPEYIIVPHTEEGDVVIWNNWGIFHTGIEYPLSYGPRSAHQCHIASSVPPTPPIVC